MLATASVTPAQPGDPDLSVARVTVFLKRYIKGGSCADVG